MDKRKLGQLEVSPIGMGCMGFSHGYGQVPPEAYAIEAIRGAYDYGCTHFDTAEAYGKEQFYAGVPPGRDSSRPVSRVHQYEIWWRAPPSYGTVQSPYPPIPRYVRHLEDSMSRLRTDYIDLYYLHRISEAVRLEDVATVMGRLIQEGLIRGWGLSQVSADQIRAAHKITPLSAVQNIYSMVERDCETEIFPVCLEKGIGVVPFSPIASGFLSGKVTPQDQFGFDDVRKFVPQLSKENIEVNQPILDFLHRFAVEKHATNAQISLAWMLHKYPNVVPIPGSKNQERILENLGAWNVTLSDDEFRQLQSAFDECKVHGHRGCVETEQTSFGKQWSEETDK